MNVPILFICAVVCMIVGHIFKVKRWGLFVSVYEDPVEGNLLNAMSIGHTINAILPIRFGDIIRVYWSGKKLKNGMSFALATVFADLYIDVFTVGAIAVVLSFMGYGGDSLLKMAHFYGMAFLIIAPLTLLCVCFRKWIKKIIRAIAAIFNATIEFRILYISYLCIASLKDIAIKIKKKKFLLFSVIIWTGYIISYFLFAAVVQRCGYNYTISDIFVELFSGSSLYHIEKSLIPIWGTFIILPLIICLIISFLWGVKPANGDGAFRRTLPQLNQADRLAFLRTYYKEDNRANIQAYLGINSDVTVLEDNSAGSNASTVVVMDNDGDIYYRKYAFDEDGEKLNEQIEWIEQHQTDIPLPIIVDKRKQDNYVTYDMHSYGKAVGLFRYVHTMPYEQSWKVLKEALDDIKNNLHSNNIREADCSVISRYIDSKVERNLEIINSDKYIKALEQYDYIIANGRELKTLKCYSGLLKKGNLLQVFAKDKYADIHGDLTIENIVCMLDNQEIDKDEYNGKVLPNRYYIIDPNTGNLHDSPYLDYSKLLQSLHGNYEFLMMVNDVKIDKNTVSFLLTKSDAYAHLYKEYRRYLSDEFSTEQMKSIYYHEIVHWLRLMPYKIRKDEKMAVVFYVGLLSVLNDIWEMEYESKDKTCNI